MMQLIYSGVAWMLLILSSVAAESVTPAPLRWPAADAVQPAPYRGFGNVALTSIALVTLVGLGLYFLKNGALPFRGQSGTERKLHVRETRMLGSRQFLVVVEYEDSKLLLGVTPGKIDYLCALESKPAAGTEFGQILSTQQETGTP